MSDERVRYEAATRKSITDGAWYDEEEWSEFGEECVSVDLKLFSTFTDKTCGRRRRKRRHSSTSKAG